MPEPIDILIRGDSSSLQAAVARADERLRVLREGQKPVIIRTDFDTSGMNAGLTDFTGRIAVVRQTATQGIAITASADTGQAETKISGLSSRLIVTRQVAAQGIIIPATANTSAAESQLLRLANNITGTQQTASRGITVNASVNTAVVQRIAELRSYITSVQQAAARGINLTVGDLSRLSAARAELQRLESQLREVQTATIGGGGLQLDQLLGGLGGLGRLGALLSGAGIGAAVTQVGRLAYELGNLGAVSITTRNSFESVTRSIGANAGLLTQLSAAAGGTISQMRLMQLANTALAGATGEVATAMAAALPRLLEAARAAAQLNPALGDAEFMFQSLITGIKRGSPLLIDNTGLVLKLGEANERYAKQLGITVEQMSAADKQLALLQATLEASDRLIQQAGSNLNNLAQSSATLAAAWADLRATIGERLAPAVSGVQSGLAGFLQGITASIQAGSDNAQVALTGLQTQLRQAQAELAQLQAQPIDPNDEFGAVRARIDILQERITNLQAAIARLTPVVQGASDAWSDAGVRAVILSQQIDNVAPAAQNASTELDALNNRLQQLKDQEQAARVNAVAMAILKGEISQATVELWGLNRAYEFLKAQGDLEKQVTDFERLQEAIKRVTEQQKEKRITVVAEAMISGELTPSERNLAMVEGGLDELYRRVMAKREAEEKKVNTRVSRDYASQMERAGQEVARKIEGYLSQGMRASIGLLDLRGAADKFAPGANGPFEDIYRLQAWINDGSWAEVAEKFGITTKEQAAEAIKQFQSGMLTPEVQKLIDIGKLVDIVKTEQAAEASYKAFAAKIAGLAGTDTTTAQSVLRSVFGGTQQVGGKKVNAVDQVATDMMTQFANAVGEQVSSGDFAGRMIGFGEMIFADIEEGFTRRAESSTALMWAIQRIVEKLIAAEFMQ